MKSATRWLRLCLMLASTALGIAAAELLVRSSGLSEPIFGQADPVLGSALRPFARGWNQTEAHAYLEINSRGLRGPEIRLQKSEGTFRICLLGDSLIEGRQVPFESTVGRQLERKLRAAGVRAEVLNFGVSGYSTAQQLVQLQTRVRPFGADLVIFSLFPGNDIRDNSLVLSKRSSRPTFFLNRQGALELDTSFASSPRWRRRKLRDDLRWPELVDHSAVLQLLRRTRKSLASFMLSRETQLEGLWGSVEVHLPPPSRDWEDAWHLTERLVQASHAESIAMKAQFLLLVLGTPLQVHPDPEIRRHFEAQTRGADIFYASDRLITFSRQHSIPVLAPARRLMAFAEAKDMFLHGFPPTVGVGHWNVLGHERMAHELSEKLLADGVVYPVAVQLD